MPIRTTRNAVAAIAAIALFPILAGCSAGGQSVADACEIMQNGTEELNSKAAELQSAITSDPESLGDLVAEVDAEISSLGEDITNEEVKPVYDRFAAAFSDLTSQLQTLAEVDVTDTEAVTEATENMTATSTELTDAQTELTEVCSA
ncbi:hypothetical protein [Microbacterium marinilacus]|uniref:Uncharacterized protein n=1 Tax=Microbacterium marinilacus TaxID=415209 RepID=A0ABP7BHD1_9MICO|nr:hypothetical protein [Microbacterium marinilacus]MBY0689529.1 hypothetical protein [Microbacterium marinilacus]